MNETLITMDNLGIGYNSRPVLSGISLSVARSSFTAILGANGSGKTTLLKTLLGLIPPVEGRIDKSASLVFGYVPQSSQFDPIYLLTGFDVALMGTYGRIGPGRFVPSAERAFTRACLRAADAGDFSRERFADLSGGQKQRILIARALATRPDVLVLDEPTAGVDVTATHAVLDFISRVCAEREIAVLLVTHEISTIRHRAGQILWLHHGKAFHGTADELLAPERIAEVFENGIS